MNRNVVNAILSYGNRYREEMLCSHYIKDELLGNWWQALEFFFGRAFFQGRRDDISAKVYDAAVAVLKDELPVLNRRFQDRNWEPLKEELGRKIGKGKVGKARDVEMVISTLDHLSNLPNRNIVAHSIERINAGEIGRNYEELQSIIQVGPKIGSFYLRDVVSLFELQTKVPHDFQFCVQPVDVWVRRLAVRTGMVPDGASDEQIRQASTRLCQEQGCSPVQFNQGAWYAGHFAFDLLLENLTAHGV